MLIGVFAFGGSDSKSAAKPADTVTTYLNDLAKGDATGALAQGPAPASLTFLSADILKQQQSKAKITNVKVADERTTGNDASVRATYQFGSQSADETFRLTKTGGNWKLRDTTFPIDVSDLTSVPQPTLFGTPIADLSKVYVFPGPLIWGSQNKYFDVTDKQSNKFAVSPFDLSASFTELTPELNDVGKQTVQTVLAAFFQKCAKSKMLSPTGYPQREYGLTDRDGEPVDGTVIWTAPTDLTGLKYSSAVEPTKLEVDGPTTWTAKFSSKSFLTNKVTTITDKTAKGNVFGKLDLGASPPTFTED